MRSILAIAIMALTACGASVSDGPVAGEPQASGPAVHPVRAELLASASAVEPGKPFWLGVRLKMQHDWHVYWKNPGDSGLPVTLVPSGPSGFSFGDMQWPLPVEFNQPGDIAGYGYTGVVFFPLEVRPPATLAEGSLARFSVEASWLACRDVCIPGSAKLVLELPVAAKAEPANAELFSEWDSRLPVETGRVAARSEGSVASGSVTLRLDWTEPVRSVEFYPVPEAALNVTDVSVQHRDRLTTIRFKASVLSGQKLSAAFLETLVVAVDASGTRRGIVVPVHIAGATAGSMPAK